MASLLSIVKQGKMCIPPGEVGSYHLSMLNKAIGAASDPCGIYINAQEVWDDILLSSEREEADLLSYQQTPAPITPPYPLMWVEAKTWQYRCAMVVRRFNYGDPSSVTGVLPHPMVELLQSGRCGEPRWAVGVTVLVEYQASAAFSEQILIFANTLGNYMTSLRVGTWGMKAEATIAYSKMLARTHTAWLVHTLARMNCKNAKLQAMHAPSCIRKRKAERGGGIVWKTIAIEQVAKAKQVTASSQEQPIEVRSHTVRGHYADYRDGKGLFGNPNLRCVFWIPEHSRGNADVGAVVKDYRVKVSTQSP